MEQPYSQACENNKAPILRVLQCEFADCRRVLEVGSGTGQHAAYFAEHLPELFWQPSDRPGQHVLLRRWLEYTPIANLGLPLPLDMHEQQWPDCDADAVFTANTLHIVAWPAVEAFFRGAGQRLPPAGVLCVYGPFNYGGDFTSHGNARFDRSLRAREPTSGIRDVEAVLALADRVGFDLHADHSMPANNRLLCWRRRAQAPTPSAHS